MSAYRAQTDDEEAASPPLHHDAISIDTSHPSSIGSDLPTSGPSARSLSGSGGVTHAGWLDKRGMTCGCIPKWKRRYCILKGRYIFKFESPDASQPKGAPIPLLDANVTLGPSLPEPPAGTPRSTHHVTMCLSTFRKDYILGTSSREEIDAWTTAISRARTRAIKQNLGHARLEADESRANKSAEEIIQRKLDAENEWEISTTKGGDW